MNCDRVVLEIPCEQCGKPTKKWVTQSLRPSRRAQTFTSESLFTRPVPEGFKRITGLEIVLYSSGECGCCAGDSLGLRAIVKLDLGKFDTEGVQASVINFNTASFIGGRVHPDGVESAISRWSIEERAKSSLKS